MELGFGGRNSDVTLPYQDVSLSHDRWAGALSNSKSTLYSVFLSKQNFLTQGTNLS